MNICIIELKFESMRSVSWKEELLLVFGFLEKTKTFRSVAESFDMSKLDLLFQVNLIVHLKIIYCSNLISWPRTDDERNLLAESFAKGAGFPNAVGAIDWTHVPISGPTAFRESYICRKGFPAMHPQTIRGPDLKFLDVFCGYP